MNLDIDVNKIKEGIALLANIVTILGIVVGVPCIFKIYNKINIIIQKTYVSSITIGQINFAEPEKGLTNIYKEKNIS